MTTKRTEEGGTEWELREAENAIIAAGDGPALALAMRRHSEAIRNMMMTEIVPSFEKAVGTLFDQKVGGPLIALQGEVSAIRGQFQGVNQRLDAGEEDRKSIHDEIAAFRKEFQGYISGSKRDEFSRRIADLERRIGRLEGDGNA